MLMGSGSVPESARASCYLDTWVTELTGRLVAVLCCYVASSPSSLQGLIVMRPIGTPMGL